MKATSILLFVIASVVGAHIAYAQSEQMHILLKNGKHLDYSVNSVEQLTLRADTFPYYTKTRLWGPSPAGTFLRHLDIANCDSLTFGSDTNHQEALLYHQSNRGGSNALDEVDSVTFAIYQTNTSLVALPNTYINPQFPEFPRTGRYNCAVWSGNRIYCSEPGRCFELDSNLSVVQDSLLDSLTGPWTIGEWSLSMNSRGNKLLSVKSRYPDVSLGHIKEHDMATGSNKRLLGDADSNLSSAVYFPGSDSIVYYSYGSYSQLNRKPVDAGYYLFDQLTGTKTLILQYISDLGPGEIVNGFDISPDRKKLLVPVLRSGFEPLIVEFELATHLLDTLAVNLNTSNVGRSLWLRYSHDGSKLLYSSYPLSSFSDGVVNDISEVGIINRGSLRKDILIAAPNTEPTWVSVFPQWSPDDNKIVFSCATHVPEPLDYLDSYQVYILKALPK